MQDVGEQQLLMLLFMIAGRALLSALMISNVSAFDFMMSRSTAASTCAR